MPGPSYITRQTGWRIENELDDIIREIAREERRTVGMQANVLLREGLKARYPERYNQMAKAKGKGEGA